MTTNTAYTTTYPLLVAELQRMVEDNTQEYTTDLPNIIARAQDRIVIDLDLEIFKDVDTGELTAEDHELALPENFILVRWLFFTSSKTFAERRALDFCKMYGGTDSVPRYFADLDEDTLYLAPAPDQDYAYEMAGLRRVTPIDGSTTTNWLTDNVPELLLYACLIESEEYLIDESNEARTQGFKASYAEKLGAERLRFADLRRRDEVIRGQTPVPAQ